MEAMTGRKDGRILTRTIRIIDFCTCQKMINKILLASALTLGSGFALQAQNLILSDGQYYTDETQTKLYTGEYTEHYENGMLKMELFLKDGRPEGTYVIYFPNGKISEVRAYYKGIFHGEWRTYNEVGSLLATANYKNGEKDGVWHIWNEKGILRFEMFYAKGRRLGTWRSWDDEGNLVNEQTY